MKNERFLRRIKDQRGLKWVDLHLEEVTYSASLAFMSREYRVLNY